MRTGELDTFTATKNGAAHLCSPCGLFMNQRSCMAQCVWGGQYVSNKSLLSFRSSFPEGSDPERSLGDLTNPSGYFLSEEMSLMLGSEILGRGIYSAAVTSECQK